MKVKIISSSNKDNWYANQIGNFYDVEEYHTKYTSDTDIPPLYKLSITGNVPFPFTGNPGTYYIKREDFKTIEELRDELINLINES